MLAAAILESPPDAHRTRKDAEFLGRLGAVKGRRATTNDDQQSPSNGWPVQEHRTLLQAEKPGHDFTNNNLVAAGALLVAIPTLIVFFALQRHFVAGLTLGANKG